MIIGPICSFECLFRQSFSRFLQLVEALHVESHQVPLWWIAGHQLMVEAENPGGADF